VSLLGEPAGLEREGLAVDEEGFADKRHEASLAFSPPGPPFLGFYPRAFSRTQIEERGDW
jgi:hypothetical protein